MKSKGMEGAVLVGAMLSIGCGANQAGSSSASSLADSVAAASYSYDARGRLTQVMYDDGATIAYEYDGAGNRTNTAASSGPSPAWSASLTGSGFRFTGRRLDAETGLYYYRARYYSPTLGRFLQPDPIGYAGGANLYAYVDNDPFNRVDPMGTDPQQPGGGEPGGGGPSPPEPPSWWDAIRNAYHDFFSGEIFRFGPSRPPAAVTGLREFFNRPEVSMALGTVVGGEVPVGTQLIRNWGGASGPFGRAELPSSWTTDPYSTLSRNRLGLETTNSGEFVSVGRLIENGGVTTRGAQPWGRFAGGGQETLVPSAGSQVQLDAVVMPDAPIPYSLPTDPHPLPFAFPPRLRP
jgi:RHS repeat-associated protein